MSARAGASGFPRGAGTSRTISCSRCSTPSPVLALTRRTSLGSQPMIPASSAAYRSGWAAWQVDLVQHRDDLEVGVQRQVQVGQRLRLDALGGVDEKHGALAGGQAAGNLVTEVDVARGVDEVEHVLLLVLARPGEPDRLALDRDAALALDVHPVQVLGPHLAAFDHAGELQHPVGQRRLAVIDVSDDAEVPDHGLIGAARRRAGILARPAPGGFRVRLAGRAGRWHTHPFELLAASGLGVP